MLKHNPFLKNTPLILLGALWFASGQANDAVNIWCDVAQSVNTECTPIDDPVKMAAAFGKGFDTIGGELTLTKIQELPQDSTAALSIKAKNANFNTTSQVAINTTGIKVNTVEFVSSEELIINVTVQAEINAQTQHDITVTTPLNDGTTETVTGVLYITEPSALPEIISIVPSSVKQGANNATVTLYAVGAHFDESSVVDFGDNHITVKEMTVHSENSLTVVLSVDSSALKKLYHITVTTGGETVKDAKDYGFLSVYQSALPEPVTVADDDSTEPVNSPPTDSTDVDEPQINPQPTATNTDNDIDQADTNPDAVTVTDDESTEPVNSPSTDSTDVDEPQINPQPTATNTDEPLPPLSHPGKIQISPDNSDKVDENAGFYRLTVQRLEGSDGEVSVKVETLGLNQSQIAIAGQDFEINSHTLTWFDGDSDAKELMITLIDDDEFEGDEILNLKLVKVTGDAILESTTLMVTIVDNENDDVEIVPGINGPNTPVIRICPEKGEMKYECSAKNITITDLKVSESGHIDGGTLKGTLENNGWVTNFILESGSQLENNSWVANLMIKPEAVLIGGILTSYIISEGTLIDIDFRGAFVRGGYLGGSIFNNSEVNGYFEDVSLMPNTRIIGGALKGQIEGDPQYPALLESLKVMRNSHLSHIIIGSNVELPNDVTLGDGVVKMENAVAINPAGEVETQALMIGGSSVNDGDFKLQNELSRSDSITIYSRIQVEPAHIGLRAEILICAAYKPLTSPRRKPLFYMIDTEDDIHLWDEEIANLVTFREIESLWEIEDIEIYSGFFDFTGVLNIYFGYRLEDGTVVYNLKTIDATIIE
ncbi:MAG: hypothetical protein DRQ41_15640 [Gammaproteobacteria bacterium]|nr:MAG: hypothetical protein DRQ41_15640 [Gammaproteobacteria bacterium]